MTTTGIDLLDVILDAALDAAAHGFAVVPPAEDGTKRPAVRWQTFQQEAPTEEQVRAWYEGDRHGLGVICGAVSGGLEMLEFEGRAIDADLHEEFSALAAEAGLIELVDRVFHGYCEWTPSGGLHLLYRVEGVVAGNTKLARRPATAEELAVDPADKIKVLVETRGEGGYVITAPSHGPVHPDGGEWRLVHGGWSTVATVTTEERDEMHRLARALDRTPRPAPSMPVSTPRTSGDDRPGDTYNASPDASQVALELLEAHGWAPVFQRGDDIHLRRPGKQVGTSAVLHLDDGTFYVFSSSTVFEQEQAYSPFAVLTVLEHDGDYSAAARALRPATSSASIYDLIERSSAMSTTTAGETVALPDTEPDEPTTAADRMRSKILIGDQVKQVPARRSLVRNWLDLNSVACLYGRSGGGKSFVAIDIGLHVATGSWWQGQRTKRGMVFYVAAEGSTGIADRQTAWEKHNKFYSPIESMAWYPEPVNLLDPVAVEALIQVAAELGPRLVIVDTLARSMSGGNENDGKDMGQFVDAADRVKRATGACVLIVHHSGKDESRGSRGHSSLPAALDTELELKSAENLLTLSTTKQKDGAEQQPLRLTLAPYSWTCPECKGDGKAIVVADDADDDHCDRCDGTGKVGSVAVAPARGDVASVLGGDLTAKQGDVLNALRSIDLPGGVSHTAWKEVSSVDYEVGSSTFNKCLHALVDAGLVHSTGDTRPKYTLPTRENA